MEQEESPFLLEGTSNSFKFYRTLTNFSTKVFPPEIYVIKETPFLFIPTVNSYAIYTLEHLKLHFLGPVIHNITAICQSGPFVYVAGGNKLYKTQRGEISSSIEIENITITAITVIGRWLILTGDTEIVVCECNDGYDNSVQSIVIDHEITPNSTVDTAQFVKVLYRMPFEKKIDTVFHPHSYVNKILISFDDGTAILFNISSKKRIFEYKFSNGPAEKVIAIAQTSVVDIVGLGRENGIVSIFNLKKNILVFEIPEFEGSLVKKLHFKDKIALIVTENTTSAARDLILYDLEIKREIYRKPGVSSGLLINETMALIVTDHSMEILTLDDMKVLKARSILNNGIIKMLAYTYNEFILHSSEKIFKVNIYKDEMNCFLKNKHSIEIASSEPNLSKMPECSVMNSNILMCGEGRMSFIDRKGKYRNFIDLKCRFAKVFDDFCILGTKTKVVVMNMKSKRVVLTRITGKTETVLDGCLDNSSITVLFTDRVCRFDFKLEVQFEFKFDRLISKGSIERLRGLYFIQDIVAGNLTVLSEHKQPNNSFGVKAISESSSEPRHISDADRNQSSDNANVTSTSKSSNENQIANKATVFRMFDVERYSSNIENGILVGIKGKHIRLYDLATGRILNSINTNKDLKDVIILDEMKFICVLDSDSHVHLLSNQAHFNTFRHTEIVGKSEIRLNIPVVKKESNFYKDLSIYKGFGNDASHELLLKGLNKEEVKELLGLIEKNLDRDFFSVQGLLTKLLLYKSNLIDFQDLKEIKKKVDEKFEEVEMTIVKGIGSLNTQPVKY